MKRTTTKWVDIPNLGMKTRIHYPIFAGKYLLKIHHGPKLGTLRRKILKQILLLIGVWEEYRVIQKGTWYMPAWGWYVHLSEKRGGDDSQ